MVTQDPLEWLEQNVDRSENENLKKLAEKCKKDGKLDSQLESIKDGRKSAEIIELIIEKVRSNVNTDNIMKLVQSIPVKEIKDICTVIVNILSISTKETTMEDLVAKLSDTINFIFAKGISISLVLAACALSHLFTQCRAIARASNVRESSKGVIKEIEIILEKIDKDLENLLELKEEYDKETRPHVKNKTLLDRLRVGIIDVLELAMEARGKLIGVEVIINAEIRTLKNQREASFMQCIISFLGGGIVGVAVGFAINPLVGVLVALPFTIFILFKGYKNILTEEKIDELEKELEQIEGFHKKLDDFKKTMKDLVRSVEEIENKLHGLKPRIKKE